MIDIFNIDTITKFYEDYKKQKEKIKQLEIKISQLEKYIKENVIGRS